ncbi:hypothetical protein EZV63_00030 [Streptomyces sp. VN1]|nr:hypothetical protein EZV63_00030 [Streptomyces sp. VN1]
MVNASPGTSDTPAGGSPSTAHRPPGAAASTDGDAPEKLFSKARAVSAAFGVTRLVVRSERLCQAG